MHTTNKMYCSGRWCEQVEFVMNALIAVHLQKSLYICCFKGIIKGTVQ